MPATHSIPVASDTRTLSEFNADAPAHIERLAATGAIEVLTVDGEARAVVMSPRVWDGLVDRLEELEVAESVRRGREDFAAGRSVDAREAILEMIAKVRDLPTPKDA
jgi:PHD/YefM family antitoxin component YafN of YafNO toxin-antitoxin module